MRESVKGMHVTQISDLIARIRRGARFSRIPAPIRPASPPPGPARGIFPPAGV